MRIDHVVEQVTEDVPDSSSHTSHLVEQVTERTPAQTRIAHLVMQVVEGTQPPLPDISGVYFVNPTKTQWHDSYYNLQERTIGPTVRTALLGE